MIIWTVYFIVFVALFLMFATYLNTGLHMNRTQWLILFTVSMLLAATIVLTVIAGIALTLEGN